MASWMRFLPRRRTPGSPARHPGDFLCNCASSSPSCSSPPQPSLPVLFAADAPATATAAPAAPATKLEDLPTEWIDPDTGHRIVRLSRQDNTQSLYFHQNPYTPDGTRLVTTIPDGIATINLQTHEIKKVVSGTAPHPAH